MVVAVTASLLSGVDPRPVQVVVTGMLAGQVYRVTGAGPDGKAWLVPGGVGVSDGNQVVMVDVLTPLNQAVTYTATVDGAAIVSAAVTVSAPAGVVAIVQTLDGQTRVPVDVASTSEPRKQDNRTAMFEVAGRSDPAARLDVPGSPAYTWLLETELGDTDTLRAILQSGSPIVRRLTGGMRDLEPVVIGIVTDWGDELLTGGGDTWRRFTLTVRQVPLPQPSTSMVVFDWDDFDAKTAAMVWGWMQADPTGSTANIFSQSPVSSGGADNGRFVRNTVSVAGTLASADVGWEGGPTGFVGASTQVTVRVYVRGVAGRTIAPRIRWNDNAVTVGATVTASGSWQVLQLTATSPAGTGPKWFNVGVQQAASGTLANDPLDIDMCTWALGASITAVVITDRDFDDLFTAWNDFDRADWVAL